MRAARLHAIGGTLQLDDDLPDPAPSTGEVTVEIAYASVNPLDIWVTRGAPGAAAANLPWIPGTEASGHVGGRPVIVRGGGLGVLRPGVYRDRIAVPEAWTVPLPPGTDLEQAAGLGVAGITAWQCVFAKGTVAADDRVLVMGASGGVGAVAVQLAASTGARVWGQTTSASKSAGITGGGAERAVVVERAGDLVAALGDFSPTVVLDPLGGAWTAPAIDALALGARLVVFGTSDAEEVTVNWRTMYRKGTTVLGYSGLVETPGEQADVLAKLIQRVNDGTLRIPIGEVLPLGDAARAHRNILDRKVEGKQLLDCRR